MEEIILNGILDEQSKPIFQMHRLKECLELRLVHITRNSAYKDEYQRNEDEIKRMDTELKIARLDKELKFQETDFLENFEIYIQELKGEKNG